MLKRKFNSETYTKMTRPQKLKKMSKSIDKLREYLKTTSDEQFEKDWNEVDGIGINGIIADEFFKNIKNNIRDIDDDIQKVINENFWDMLNNNEDE